MINEVVLNKVEIIERCLKRIHEVYDSNPENLNDYKKQGPDNLNDYTKQSPDNLNNYTKQDSIILNIQRCCEASIDIGMHLTSIYNLGVPKTNRDAFKLLNEAGIIDDKLANSLMNMVGFRNVAVHDYQSLDLNIMKSVLEKHLGDFEEFTKIIVKNNI